MSRSDFGLRAQQHSTAQEPPRARKSPRRPADKTFWLSVLSALLFCSLYAGASFAGKNLDLTHYGYAAYLGSGLYQTSDRSVKVFNIPMSYTVHPSGKQWKINIRFPATLGFYNFDPSDIIESGLPRKVETLTFVPGVELIMSVRENWSIQPFVDYGMGLNFENDNTISIYAAGIRSLSNFDIGRKGSLILSNRYYYVGQEENNTRISGNFRALENGISINPGYELSYFGRPADLNFHYVNFIYSNLRFLKYRDQAFEIKVQNEIGFTLVLARKKPFKIFDLPRIGLGYRWGNKLRVVRLILGAPF